MCQTNLAVAPAMRRDERQVADYGTLCAFLEDALACHLALNRPDAAPYIVTLCYGYDFDTADGPLTLWFHCADEGFKLDLLRSDPRVGFQVVSGMGLSTEDSLEACEWGMDYQSIVGEGRMRIVEDPAERAHGLARLLAHYGADGLSMGEQALARTTVLRLDAERLSGKQRCSG